jgi:hypothetical protein
MKIALFSLNCASKKSIPLFEDRDVFDHDPEYFVEMTQEDYRSKNAPSLFASVPTNYTLLALQVLNEKQTKQNLQIRLYKRAKNYSPQSGPTKEIEQGRIPIPPKGVRMNTFKNKAVAKATELASQLPFLPLGYTKGAVWIKIKDPMPILFINMHLPMKKNQENLGLSLRVAALQKILQELQAYIDTNTTVVIGGDLNFRIAPQENGHGVNQLTSLLFSNARFGALKELPIKPEDKLFTCKFRKAASQKKKLYASFLGKELNADPAANCNIRRAKVTASNNATLRNRAKNLQEKCGASDRFPSRCDRFLYHLGDGVQMDTLQNKGYPFFPKSDHNAVYATISLSALPEKPLNSVNSGDVEEEEEEEEYENSESVGSDPKSPGLNSTANGLATIINPMYPRYAPTALLKRPLSARESFAPLQMGMIEKLKGSSGKKLHPHDIR